MQRLGTASILVAVVLGLCLTWVARAAEPAAAPAAGGAQGGYHIAKVFNLGGEGRWDYATVDPAAKRLYLSRQTHVQVVDTDSGKLVADLPDTPGVHGIAIAPDLDRFFTSNGQGNSVTAFDRKTNKALGTTPAGQNPDAILYDPASKRVFAFNGRSRDATVIDPAAKDGSPAPARIPLDAKPEFGVSDGAGHVYVNLEDKSSVAVIDTKTMKVTDVWKIEGGEGPSGLAIDLEHHRLFSGCGGNQVMAVLDAKTGKTLATVPIGKGVDACAFDPGTGEAFASCGDGTLTVAKETAPGKYEVVQTVQTRRGAKTMALDPTTHTVYLPTAEFPDQAAGGGGRPAPKPGTFAVVVVSRESK